MAVPCSLLGSRSWSLMHRVLYRLLVAVVTLLVRSGGDKDLNIVVVRHQLTVVCRQIDRQALTEPDRRPLGAIAAALPHARRADWPPPTRCCAGSANGSPVTGANRTVDLEVHPSR